MLDEWRMKFPSAFPSALAVAPLLMLPFMVMPMVAAVVLPDSLEVESIDHFIEAAVRQNGLVGLSVAILKDGEIILNRGYGRQSIARGEPVKPDTLFAIGSVTKQFTCACVLLLAEDGKLSVHDNVAKYYPALTRAGDITLLDLMNHTSGYPDYYPLDFVDRRMQKPIVADDLLSRYAGGKLDFEPGTRYSYSNTGYILLGQVVEKVTGESFETFLSRRILTPLGMTNTLYEPDASNPRIARGHTSFALSSPEAIEPEARGWVGAAGGIFSTPGDLAKWDLALVTGKVLKPQSYGLMTAVRPLQGGKISDYGCGLAVRVQAGRQVLSHNGAVAGFNAWKATIPSTRSGVIMFCNLDGGLGSLPSQVFSLLLKEPANVPTVKGPLPVEMARRLFTNLQAGEINRAEFSADFNGYLTDLKIAGTSQRLKRLGTLGKAELVSTQERGGMEVSTTRLIFPAESLRALMYRKPDGTVEQFFLYKD
jgi:D-alanyl-D-alanine carboxypeptidase